MDMPDDRSSVIEAKVDALQVMMKSELDSQKSVLETKINADQHANARIEKLLGAHMTDYQHAKEIWQSDHERLLNLGQMISDDRKAMVQLQNKIEREARTRAKADEDLRNKRLVRELIAWIGFLAATVIAIIQTYNLFSR